MVRLMCPYCVFDGRPTGRLGCSDSISACRRSPPLHVPCFLFLDHYLDTDTPDPSPNLASIRLLTLRCEVTATSQPQKTANHFVKRLMRTYTTPCRIILIVLIHIYSAARGPPCLIMISLQYKCRPKKNHPGSSVGGYLVVQAFRRRSSGPALDEHICRIKINETYLSPSVSPVPSITTSSSLVNPLFCIHFQLQLLYRYVSVYPSP
ncbi:hypothetical protein B0H12DRAFT_1145107 [Mycena haematopus]|nr:hypothetical protein B0H12DRAFT_1145107 [Mycena haematopus]